MLFFVHMLFVVTRSGIRSARQFCHIVLLVLLLFFFVADRMAVLIYIPTCLLRTKVKRTDQLFELHLPKSTVN